MSDSDSDFWVYPLRWGETLATHEWVEWHIHRFLTSRFLAYTVAEGRRAEGFTAMVLWSEAFRQDPAGTLPDDDVQLAGLARYGADLAGWRAARAGALYGWSRCHVDGEATDGVPRLGHRFLAEIAGRMNRRKLSRDQGRRGAAIAVRHSRIRKKLQHMGFKMLATQPDAVTRIDGFLGDANLWISDDNLRAALDAIGVPRVVKGNFGGGGDN